MSSSSADLASYAPLIVICDLDLYLIFIDSSGRPQVLELTDICLTSVVASHVYSYRLESIGAAPGSIYSLLGIPLISGVGEEPSLTDLPPRGRPHPKLKFGLGHLPNPPN